MARVMRQADVLIAVAPAEAEALRQFLPDVPPVAVVPSGVDAFYWSDDRGLWGREQGRPLTPDDEDRRDEEPRCGVLCVGRFDPQKGQHRLIRAVAPLGVPLTLLGATNPNYPRYRRLCQRLAGPGVTLLPPLPYATLRRLYRRSHVHAQCSWYELSSLSALEAAACGANVVTTTRGGMRDYFGDLAWYADPGDDEGLRAAVQSALATPPRADLARHVRQHFRWEQSASLLLQVYQRLLGDQSFPLSQAA
jgi:glycosyltransferase involved in cell wall biosynthesis